MSILAVAGEIIWCVIVRDTSMFEEATGVLQHLVTAAIKEGSFYEAARHTLRMGLDALAQVQFCCMYGSSYHQLEGNVESCP